MSKIKVTDIISEHLKAIVDYGDEPDTSADIDAMELLAAIEKFGYTIVRRSSPATRERLKHRVSGWNR